MKPQLSIAPLAALLALAAATSVASPIAAQSAQSARADLVVEPVWLMENLDRPDLVVLHVAASEEAMANDPVIPGSGVLHLGQISYNQNEEGGPRIRLDLPADLAGVRSTFEALGVSDDSRVVVVYDGNRAPNATRTVWTLQTLGKAEGVSILNGGLEAWTAAGGEVTTERTRPRAGAIRAEVRLDRRVDARWVLDNGQAPGVALIDARRTASWDGTQPEIPGRSGHIPGAGSLPQIDLWNDQGRLKGEDELRALFARAGVQDGDGVVAYCHIGLWASAVVFAARTLGLDARLYDGSMTEWADTPDLPMVLPEAGNR